MPGGRDLLGSEHLSLGTLGFGLQIARVAFQGLKLCIETGNLGIDCRGVLTRYEAIGKSQDEPIALLGGLTDRRAVLLDDRPVLAFGVSKNK